jgi:hypothetical protein
MYQLRDREFTRAEAGLEDGGTPFRELITQSEAFQFDLDDIERFRTDVKTLIDRLTALYVQVESTPAVEEEGMEKAEPEREEKPEPEVESREVESTAKDDEAAPAKEVDIPGEKPEPEVESREVESTAKDDEAAPAKEVDIPGEKTDPTVANTVATQAKAKPTVEESCSHLEFYIGPHPDHETATKHMIALRAMGLEVHDVTGDGNCGYYCLIVGLTMAGYDTDPKELRRVLQTNAAAFKEEIHLIPQYRYYDHEAYEELYSRGSSLLYSKRLQYKRAFMEKKNKKGKFVNKEHWMDLNLTLPIFCLEYRFRVVVYHAQGDSWTTYIFDGREDELHVEIHDGMVPEKGRTSSFGLYYDGEHYEYLTLPA